MRRYTCGGLIPSGGNRLGVVAVAGVMALVVQLPLSTAGAAVGAVKWTVETPTQQYLAKDLLSGVQCTTASWCVSVGSTENGMLAEVRNGKSWTAYQPATAAGQVDPGLNSVSCSSASDCVAVGAFLYPHAGLRLSPLSEIWNGKGWTAAPTPLSAGDSNGYLTQVSCSGATFCMAVGFESVNSSSLELPLAEQWNGHTWHLAAPKENKTNTGLYSVSCTSASACTVLGGDPTEAFRWNGATWSIKALPEPAGGNYLVLAALSCPATTACMAVGSYIANKSSNVPVSETWNGTAWSVVPTAPSTGTPNLSAVNCSSKSDCVTVGSLLTGTEPNFVDTPISEVWNGTKWVMPATPRPSGSSSLQGVWCPAASDCLAVGESNPGTETLDLTETWNGHSWGIVAAPSPLNALVDVLAAVSCVASQTCEAVGASAAGLGENIALAERWAGSSWKLTIEAAKDTPTDTVSSVSCTTTSSCVALGADVSGAPVSLLWNGKEWSVGPAPAPKGQDELLQVSCASSTSCTAVGAYAGSSGPLPLVEHWNGVKWTLGSVAIPNGANGILDGVSCPSTSDCVAVGSYEESSFVGFAAHWNGSTWTISKGVAPSGTVDFQFNGVSCAPGTTSCTVVGGYTKTGKNSLNLADSFDDLKWSVESVVQAPTPTSQLTSVSCPTASSCTAVGNYFPSQTTTAGIIETLTGKTWSVVPSPSPHFIAYGLSCTAAGSCMLVGQTDSGAATASEGALSP
jgi:hypothetical protein